MNFATTKERILKYLDYKSITKKNFYEKTSIKRGFLDSNKMKGAVSDEMIAKIIAIYSEISPEWLITGSGEMLRNTPESNISMVQEPSSGYGLSKESYYFPEGVSAGTLSIISDNRVSDENKIPRVVGFEDCELITHVVGDSMYSRFTNGDKIACKKDDIRNIKYGEPYVIGFKSSDPVLKRIKPSKTNGKVWLHSDNAYYDPFEVDLNEISSVYLVKGILTTNTGKNRDYEKEIKDLIELLTELKDELTSR